MALQPGHFSLACRAPFFSAGGEGVHAHVCTGSQVGAQSAPSGAWGTGNVPESPRETVETSDQAGKGRVDWEAEKESQAVVWGLAEERQKGDPPLLPPR